MLLFPLKKDTVEHVFEAVDWTFAFVQPAYLLPEIEEPKEVSREGDVLADAFRNQAHPQVERSVRAEAERSPSVVRVHFLRTQEAFELQTHTRKHTNTRTVKVMVRDMIKVTASLSDGFVEFLQFLIFRNLEDAGE